MKLVFASDNKNKLREFKSILGDVDAKILTKSEAGVFGEIKETGKTFKENAQIKAHEVYRRCFIPTVADDSGLMVEAISGAPGVESARYASTTGKNATDADNIAKLLNELETIENRTAKFVCTICLYTSDGPKFFEGECHGEIAKRPSGKSGFGYDPVFLYNGVSFADMPKEEKNKVSHRYNAVLQLKEYLKTVNLNDDCKKEY